MTVLFTPELVAGLNPATPGVNVMLMGPAGTGKTHSIGTLVEPGLEVFYIGMEPGLESINGYFTDQGKPVPPNLHTHLVEAQLASFSELIAAATKVNTMNLESLAKSVDLTRDKYNQFIGLLKALSNFVDQRTGECHGPVDKWTAGSALVIDGLTGICNAAMSLVVGGKPVRSQSDWGIAQNQVESLIRKLCNDCKCHFVLISHVEREVDQVMGGVKIMASALGKALAPKLPPMFSDVILCTREGTTWKWDTASAIADVKTRSLPIAGNNSPTFQLIMEKWQQRFAGHMEKPADSSK